MEICLYDLKQSVRSGLAWTHKFQETPKRQGIRGRPSRAAGYISTREGCQIKTLSGDRMDMPTQSPEGRWYQGQCA